MKIDRFARRLLCLAAVSSILSGFALGQSEDLTPFPEPTGPYQVGIVSRYFVDESREETATRGDHNDKRELMVQFWYPAEVEAGAVPAPYLPDSELIISTFNEAVSRGARITLALVPEKFAGFSSHAFPDAALSDDQANYPVLIFSHGAAGMPEFSTVQLEELVSHGYIVVAINHTYGSAAVRFPDDRVITYAAVSAQVLVDDLIFMVNQLELMNTDDPEGMFTNRLNLEQLGVFGLSAGGEAVILACSQDSRFRACVNQDGQAARRDIATAIEQPLMFMYPGGRLSPELAIRSSINGPTYNIGVDGFRHASFSDMIFWPDVSPLIEAGFLGDMDPLRAAEITNAYLLAFFDHYLKGEAAPLLDGPSLDYPEVDFEQVKP